MLTGKKITCNECQKLFIYIHGKKNNHRNHCSKKCFLEHRRKKRNKIYGPKGYRPVCRLKEKKEYTCKGCGQLYKTAYQPGYCTKECRIKYRSIGPVPYTCDICGETKMGRLGTKHCPGECLAESIRRQMHSRYLFKKWLKNKRNDLAKLHNND